VTGSDGWMDGWSSHTEQCATSEGTGETKAEQECCTLHTHALTQWECRDEGVLVLFLDSSTRYGKDVKSTSVSYVSVWLGWDVQHSSADFLTLSLLSLSLSYCVRRQLPARCKLVCGTATMTSV